GPPMGSEAPAARLLAPRQYPAALGRDYAGVSPVPLDRVRRVAVNPCRKHPRRAPLSRCRAPGTPARWPAVAARRPTIPASTRRTAGPAPGALSHARLLSAHGGSRIGCRDAGTGDFRDRHGRYVGAARPADRPRSRRIGRAHEAGRLFLMAARDDSEIPTFGALLRRETQKGLLRFMTCGSVDDGKSTLLGRLLYDSGVLFSGQLASLRSDSARFGAAE